MTDGSAASPALEVLDPGLLLTVQDLGRPGYEHLGVPPGGAADAASLRTANRLVGNAPGAAVLEATLLGPRLRAIRPIVVAVAGARLEPFVSGADGQRRPLAPPVAATLGEDDVLAFGEPGDPQRGCRVYIAVRGGIEVPLVLGSRSTSLVGAFGGLDGRPLRAGDRLSALAPVGRVPPAADASNAGDDPPTTTSNEPIAILRGPAASEPGGVQRLRAFVDTTWTVSLASDRRGIRLEAPVGAGPEPPSEAGDRPSRGMVVGAVQLPPDGQPIVLMPDGGVTGGYPVIAVVTSRQRSRLGQLAPSAVVRFALAD